MTLSDKHQALLALISSWCRKADDPKGFLVFEDTVGEIQSELPPPVAGYRPDLAWLATNGRFRFIGEAKTADDLLSSHTRKQLEAFIKHLAQQGEGDLIVAVPWGEEGTAGSILSHTQSVVGTPVKRWTVISDAPAKARANQRG